ncbi:MAG TPA: FAD-dependent oxidoreductase [Rhizobiales bacterium]|nr:FAD-dependent oxidoreductase [Hyphomicrobiales bacterium]
MTCSGLPHGNSSGINSFGMTILPEATDMPGPGRRQVLAGGGAFLAAPFISRPARAADRDVVIIGAGAAGLAAARALSRRGLSVALIEASGRIGGRAHTESATFGVPFDQGCTFLHNARRNPFVKYARASGFAISSLPPDDATKVYTGAHEASAAQYRAMDRRYRAVHAALLGAGREGRDISMGAAIAQLGRSRWQPLAGFWHSLATGQELEDVSVVDWWNAADGKDYHCRAGYGALVAHFGRGLPVHLSTRAREINWSGSGVKVVTNKGTLRARAAIVTVSLGVLAAEAIRFVPPLPVWKQRAIDGFAMGSYVTIGLQFKQQRVLPVPDNAWFWIDGRPDELLEFMSNMGGWGVSRANAAGHLGLELEGAGRKEAVDFALSRLKSALGPRITRLFARGSFTGWTGNPLTFGTWAMARPGHAGARKLLAEPVGKRIFLAGEACHEDMFATCHGALLSGQTTARHVAHLLKNPL